jgi:hypothetical protein
MSIVPLRLLKIVTDLYRTLFSDMSGLVSSPLMPEVGDVTSLVSLQFMSNRRKKPETAVLSHIKLQLIKATEMKRAENIKQWLLALAKTMASHGKIILAHKLKLHGEWVIFLNRYVFLTGLDKELHLLCEDLLGPTHSLGSIGAWLPTIAVS